MIFKKWIPHVIKNNHFDNKNEFPFKPLLVRKKNGELVWIEKIYPISYYCSKKNMGLNDKIQDIMVIMAKLADSTEENKFQQMALYRTNNGDFKEIKNKELENILEQEKTGIFVLENGLIAIYYKKYMYLTQDCKTGCFVDLSNTFSNINWKVDEIVKIYSFFGEAYMLFKVYNKSKTKNRALKISRKINTTILNDDCTKINVEFM